MYLNKLIVVLIYITFWVYNWVDIYQTDLLLKLGAYEANPVLVWFSELLNMDIIQSITIFKTTFLILLGIGLVAIYTKQQFKKEMCVK